MNRSQDEAAKIGSKYSPAQLELFNKIIILLVAEARGEVRSIALLNSAAELERKLSAKNAQVVLLYSQSGYILSIYRVGFAGCVLLWPKTMDYSKAFQSISLCTHTDSSLEGATKLNFAPFCSP